MYHEELLAANAAAFMKDARYRAKRECWDLVSSELHKAGVTYALACSAGMFFIGIVDDFHDFDVIISEESIEKAKQVFETIGEKVNLHESAENDKFFDDKFFATYRVKGVEFDVMSEFTLVTFGTRYRYHFLAEHVVSVPIAKGMDMPVVPAEAQYLLYSMMSGWQPQRKFKKDLLRQYLYDPGTQKPDILREALHKPIPWWLKEEIRLILGQ